MNMKADEMNYLLLVLCHNEIHYIKLFESKLEAQTQAILLANEWYSKDGVKKFTLNGIKSIEQMREYYQSEAYFNSGDSAHVVIVKLNNCNLNNKICSFNKQLELHNAIN